MTRSVVGFSVAVGVFFWQSASGEEMRERDQSRAAGLHRRAQCRHGRTPANVTLDPALADRRIASPLPLNGGQSAAKGIAYAGLAVRQSSKSLLGTTSPGNTPGAAIPESSDGDRFLSSKYRAVAADSPGVTGLSNLTSSRNLPINSCQRIP